MSASPTTEPEPRRFELLDQSERTRLITRTTLTCAGIVALTLTAYALSPDHSMGAGDIVLRVALAVVFISAAILLAALSIWRSEFPLLRAVEALTAVVSVVVVVFAFVYVITSGSDAAAFSEPLDHTGALYFSMTAATTVGFGDIHPVSNPARIIVMIQLITNVVVIGVVVRLLFATAKRRARSS